MLDSNAPSRWWEWRAFANDFELRGISLPPEFEAADETVVVSPVSDARVVIRDDVLTVDRIERHNDGLDLWRRSLHARFPLCQHDVRDVLRELKVTPPTLFRPEFSARQFVEDVAACTDGLHVVGVRCNRRIIPVGGCSVERAAVSMAGRVMQTVCVSGPDEIAVSAVVHSLQLHHLASRNIVDTIRELVDVSVHANA